MIARPRTLAAVLTAAASLAVVVMSAPTGTVTVVEVGRLPSIAGSGVGPPAATANAPLPAGDGAADHDAADWTPDLPVRETRAAADGFLVAVGDGPVVGPSGRLLSYTIEVHPSVIDELDGFVESVRWILEDGDRGWTSRGEYRLRWIDDPSVADVRVVLAPPSVVDAFCQRQGLETNGMYSCWDQDRALLNHDRWTHGAGPFGSDVGEYRIYLVNHEVGHGLGFGHVDCPAPRELAPVMMQQTRSVDGCLPNGWPHP